MPYSVQLYSLRNAMQEDLKGTLRKVAGIEFTQVELFDFAATTRELQVVVNECGLDVPRATGHSGTFGTSPKSRHARR